VRGQIGLERHAQTGQRGDPTGERSDCQHADGGAGFAVAPANDAWSA
jgi:hypothetical protein